MSFSVNTARIAGEGDFCVDPRNRSRAMAAREEGEVLHSKIRHHDGPRSVNSSEGFRNGYVKSCVTPLKQDRQRGFLVNVCSFCNQDILSSKLLKVSALYVGALAILVLSFLISRSLQSDPLCDLRTFLSGFSQSISPLFSIGCAFFFLTFYLRRKKKESSKCWLASLPASCYLGDFLVLRVLQWGEEQHQMQMVGRLLFVLGCVGLLTLIPTLKLKHSVLILVFASVVWLVSLTSLSALPALLRPLAACLSGVSGSLLALWFDRYYPPRDAPSGISSAEEKVPVIRLRRRSSCVSLGETSTSYYGSCKMPRRPSLPCISREQVGLYLQDRVCLLLLLLLLLESRPKDYPTSAHVHRANQNKGHVLSQKTAFTCKLRLGISVKESCWLNACFYIATGFIFRYIRAFLGFYALGF